LNIDSVYFKVEPDHGPMSLYAPHHYPGKLIVIEGVDASSRSRQFSMLRDWLETAGVPIFFTEWNASTTLQKSVDSLPSSEQLLPVSFSILNASDFAERIENVVAPALKVGIPVLMDGYCYSALARDVVRGVDKDWVRNLYAFAVRPDAIFYCHLSGDQCLQQRSENGVNGFFECGMDLELSKDPKESYRLFQSLQIAEFEGMASEFAFQTVSDEPSPPQQEALVSTLMQIIST
jgi:dTMP kinase